MEKFEPNTPFKTAWQFAAIRAEVFNATIAPKQNEITNIMRDFLPPNKQDRSYYLSKNMTPEKRDQHEKEIGIMLQKELPHDVFKRTQELTQEIETGKKVFIHSLSEELSRLPLPYIEQKEILAFTGKIMDGTIRTDHGINELWKAYNAQPNKAIVDKVAEETQRDTPLAKELFTSKFYGMELYKEKDTPERQKGKERNENHEKEK